MTPRAGKGTAASPFHGLVARTSRHKWRGREGGKGKACGGAGGMHASAERETVNVR